MYNDPNAPQPPYGQNPYDPSSQPSQQNPYEQNPYSQPQQQQYGPTQYGAPPYGAPPDYAQPYGTPPGYAQPQPKKSNRALWITLGIIGGVLILACGTCAVLFSLGIYSFGQTVKTSVSSLEATATAAIATTNADLTATSATAPTQTAEAYYTAIQGQDYTTAYSYLDSNLTTPSGTPVTQNLFATAAQSRDSSLGKVTNFTATADSTDPTKVTITVTRGSGAPYTVHMQLSDTSGEWKIVSYDNI